MPLKRPFRRARAPFVRRSGMRRRRSGFRRTSGTTRYSTGGMSAFPRLLRGIPLRMIDIGYGSGTYSSYIPFNAASPVTGIVVNALAEDSSPLTVGSLGQQGTSIQQFLGNQVWLKYLVIRGQVVCGAVTGVASGFMAVVYDKAPRGVLPAYADIFGSGSTGAQIYPAASLQRSDNMDRFQVLWRKDFNCERTGAYNGTTLVAANTVSSSHNVNVCVSLRGRKTTMTGGTVTSMGIANINQGAVYMVFMSSGVCNAELAPFNTSDGIFGTFQTRVAFVSQ